MIEIYAKTDPSGGREHVKYVHCPECGQKLADMELLSGHVRIKLKCRRCKRYIQVDAVGK